MKTDRTKIWYQKDGVPQYKEIGGSGYVPFVDSFGHQYYSNEDKTIPNNFWNLLREKLDGYSFYRDDGPSVIHVNGLNYYCSFNNGKIISGFSSTWVFAKSTNHLICNVCYNFCKQNCFS